MNEIIINLEGKEYQIDIQKAKELGVIKEKDTRCKSWEEFEKKYQNKQGFCYSTYDLRIELTCNPIMSTDQLTEDEAIAIKAFSKLLKLRRDWVGTWEPNWNNDKIKYCVTFASNTLHISQWDNCSHPFSFPTKEIAVEFLNCFSNLFEQCKYLI